MPPALILADLLDEFGAAAILDGPLGVDEIADIRTAQNVVAAYKSREMSGEWAVWANENPKAHELLVRAVLAAEELNG